MSLAGLAIGVPVRAKAKAFLRVCFIWAANSPYWVLWASSMNRITFFLVWMVSCFWLSLSSSFWSCVNSSGRNLWIRVMKMPRFPLFSSCFRIVFKAYMESMVSGLVMSRAVNSWYSCSWSSSRSTMKNMVGFSSCRWR